MTNKTIPILSICIPTYNRAEYLIKSILSITKQKEFLSGEVEIVISDNSSIDNTESVCRQFADIYPNFIYHKNHNNIRDMNFPKAISMANGVYRKLCNDTLQLTDDSLQHMISVINCYSNDKPSLIFANNNKRMPLNSVMEIFGLNDFVLNVSYYSTAIGIFGIWASDFENIEDKNAGCETSLWQVKTTFDTIIKNNRAIIDNFKIFYSPQKVERKDLSYGIFKVFYTNFFKIAATYNKDIPKKTISFLQKDILINYFSKWAFNLRAKNNKYLFSKNESLEREIIKHYFLKPYLYFFIFCQYYKNMKYTLNRTINKIMIITNIKNKRTVN